VDFDAAVANLLGCSEDELGEIKLPEKALRDVWKEFICRLSNAYPLRARSRALVGRGVIYDWISLMGIDEVYVP
jgi:hypothetical protein